MEPGARLCLALCLAGVLPAPGCRGAPGRFAYKLLHELFANYSSALRPVEDTDRALNVTLKVTLAQIIDMDERNQVLTSYLWVRQTWLDAHLTWDKDEYGGIDSIRIPSSYVWRPDIILYNKCVVLAPGWGWGHCWGRTGGCTGGCQPRRGAGGSWRGRCRERGAGVLAAAGCGTDPTTEGTARGCKGMWPHGHPSLPSADERFGGSMETNVVLRSDGHVTWDSPAITKSSCKVDVSYFPFDGQQCRLTFGSWTHNGNQIDLRNQLDSGDLTDFVENVEWEVLGMPATRNVITYGCCSEPYPDVTFTLLLRRRASFYIFNLLLPCIMVSFLAPLGFYLPADSGEKVSLGVTVLLALTVFQLLVAESMPPSESVPLIGKYYIATMTMITASTALTIFIMNVHHCGPGARPVPPWARRLILHHMARLCCVYEVGESCKGPRRAAGGREAAGESPAEGQVGAEVRGCPWHHCLCHHEALLRNVGYIAGCFRRHRANQRRAGEWKRVAKVMDRFFMWVFFLMVFLMSVLVLGNAA
ncbi:neuronal acetylcholine receptor subunit alpha-10 isoform X1 [Passer domesticus]|uniref:neuronal acetylcholine receptor subunit alpha-10 isoform X1 n=1 Tax=Passer domesticus TaxID=48849 RepID=UPI0030FE262B